MAKIQQKNAYFDLFSEKVVSLQIEKMEKTMINISLPDGSVKQFEQGVTPYDVAKSIKIGRAHV